MSNNELDKKMEMWVQFGGFERGNTKGGLVSLVEIMHPCDTCDEDWDYCDGDCDHCDVQIEHTGIYKVAKAYGVNYFGSDNEKSDENDEIEVDDLGDAMQIFRQWVLETKNYLEQ